MVDVNKLKGKIAENGFSQRTISALIGMNEATFYRRMKKGVFNSDEIDVLIKVLHIDNPVEIFFAESVS